MAATASIDNIIGAELGQVQQQQKAAQTAQTNIADITKQEGVKYKDFSDQLAALKATQPKTPDIKPFQAPQQQNPASMFGSAAGILATLASFATKTPLTASLNSMAQGMKAIREGNADAYDKAFKEWQTNTDYALKMNDLENNHYQQSLELAKTDYDTAMANLQNQAHAQQDMAMLSTLPDLSKAGELVLGRQRLAVEAAKAQAEMGWLAPGAGGKGDKSGATGDPKADQTLDFAAKQYLLTGQLPQMGFGAAGANFKMQVLRRASEIAAAKGDDVGQVVADRASRHADTLALGQVTKYRAMVDSFAQTANANAEMALNLADKGGAAGGVPVLNKWIQSGRANVAGDPEVTSFNAALTTFKNEYAKIMSGATGGQGSTDSSRREADELINNAMTPAQLRSTIATMQQEMGNRKQSLDDQEQQLTSSIRGEPDTTGVGPWKVDSSWPPAPKADGKFLVDIAGDTVAKSKNGKWVAP